MMKMTRDMKTKDTRDMKQKLIDTSITQTDLQDPLLIPLLKKMIVKIRNKVMKMMIVKKKVMIVKNKVMKLPTYLMKYTKMTKFLIMSVLYEKH